MMKSNLIISTIAALTAAQGDDDLPVCSIQCLSTAISNLGCAPADFSCSCQKADQLNPVVTLCVQTACSNLTDQRTTIEVLSSICAAASFPIEASEAPSSSTAAEPTPGPTTSKASVETQPSSTDKSEHSEYSTLKATFTASEYSAPSHPTSDFPTLPSSYSDLVPLPSYVNTVVVSHPSPEATSIPGLLPPYPTRSPAPSVPAPSGTGAPTTSLHLPEFTGAAAVAVKVPMVAVGVFGFAAVVL